jgi:hypothetical protein
MWTYGKPVIVGEFGYYPHGDGWADTDGTHIHNGIWSAAMTLTGAMCWWWDNYIHPNDLYYHYAGLSGFFEGEDLRYPPMDTLHVLVDGPEGEGTSSATARGYAIGSSACAFVWVQDPGNTIGGTPQDTLSGVSLKLPGMIAGDYEILYWNTYEGVPAGADTVYCSGDTLGFELPEFSLDLALKLKKTEEAGVVGSAHPSAGPPFGLEVRTNPFTAATGFALTCCHGAEATVSVYDVGGRLLWTAIPRADLTLDWDGVDSRGEPLSAGIYFAIARAGSQRAAAKVVILR